MHKMMATHLVPRLSLGNPLIPPSQKISGFPGDVFPDLFFPISPSTQKSDPRSAKAFNAWVAKSGLHFQASNEDKHEPNGPIVN